MAVIEQLPVVHENKLLIEAIKQHGQLATAYAARERNFCIETQRSIKFLEDVIKDLMK